MRELGFALALLFGLSALQPAWADRAPTPEERAVIEAVLLSEGFLRWEHTPCSAGERSAVAVSGHGCALDRARPTRPTW